MPRKRRIRRVVLSKSVINKKALPKPKTPADHIFELFFKPAENPKVVVSESGTPTSVVTAPVTLRSYGNLNRVIARNVLVSMDIENRRPQGLTEEIVASSLLNTSPEKSLAKKIKSRRLNA